FFCVLLFVVLHSLQFQSNLCLRTTSHRCRNVLDRHSLVSAPTPCEVRQCFPCTRSGFDERQLMCGFFRGTSRFLLDVERSGGTLVASRGGQCCACDHRDISLDRRTCRYGGRRLLCDDRCQQE